MTHERNCHESGMESNEKWRQVREVGETIDKLYRLVLETDWPPDSAGRAAAVPDCPGHFSHCHWVWTLEKVRFVNKNSEPYFLLF